MAAQLLLGLGLLVFIHELGHFLAARAFGIRVEKFYVFFDFNGIKLFSKKIGDTEYGIGWFPLGGYVKISGMVDESLDLEQLAAISGICIEDLEYLNPAVQNRMIPVSNQFMALNVPKSKAGFITENKEEFSDAVRLTSERSVALRTNSIATANISKPAAAATTSQVPSNQDKITYVVRSGDVLGTIAQKHGTTVTNIKNWNICFNGKCEELPKNENKPLKLYACDSK